MTESERLKSLRNELHMKQGDFAKSISTTQGHISDIENGRKNLSERTIKLICLKAWNGNFVREDWLRTGDGDMFVKQSPADETASLLQDMMDNDNVFYDVIYSILDEFQHLDSKNREAFLIFTQKVVDNFQKKEKKRI